MHCDVQAGKGLIFSTFFVLQKTVDEITEMLAGLVVQGNVIRVSGKGDYPVSVAELYSFFNRKN